MERAQLCRTRTAQGLAVDGDVLDRQRLLDGLHPLTEASLECPRLDAVEDAFKGIMRGTAVGKLQEPLEPVAALAAEERDLLPVLGAGNDRAKSDDNDVV